MAQIEEIKQSFTNEIKKQNKKINSITKNYNILNDEYLSLLNIAYGTAEIQQDKV